MHPLSASHFAVRGLVALDAVQGREKETELKEERERRGTVRTVISDAILKGSIQLFERLQQTSTSSALMAETIETPEPDARHDELERNFLILLGPTQSQELCFPRRRRILRR